MPQSRELVESENAAAKPKMVLAGVRSQSIKKIVDSGFDVIAKVVKDEVDGVAVKDYPEVTIRVCLLYTSPSPRDATLSRMPSSA